MLLRVIWPVWLLSLVGTAYFSLGPVVNPTPYIDWGDKLMHGLAYAWLGLYPPVLFRRVWPALLLLVLYGLALEILQPLFDRNFDLVDALCNTLGAGAGATASLAVFKRARRQLSAHRGASQ